MPFRPHIARDPEICGFSGANSTNVNGLLRNDTQSVLHASDNCDQFQVRSAQGDFRPKNDVMWTM